VLLVILSTISRVIEAIPVPVLAVLLSTLTALRVAALLAAIPFGAIGTTLSTLPGRIIAMTTSVGAARAGFASFASFLGGPWVVAIAAATLGIGYIISQSAKQRAEVDKLTNSLGSYADALKNGVNRESLNNAATILKQDASLRGLVTTMNQLNVTQDDLVRGLNGDRDARKIVIDALNQQIAIEQERANRLSKTRPEEARAAADRAQELENMRKAFAKTNTANAEANDLTRKYTEQITLSVGATSLYKQSIDAAGNTVASYATKIDALQGILDVLSNKTATAKDVSEAFKRAIDNITLSAINASEAEERQTEANISLSRQMEATTDKIRESSLGFDINTAKTDANKEAVIRNRNALEAALLATREKMYADIAAGDSLEVARQKNEDRIAEILKEIPANQRNTKSVDDLVNAYGRVPPEVATAMKTTGVEAVMKQLKELKAAQLALDLNITGADAMARIESGNQYRVFAATGGPVRGPGGPTEDRVAAWLPTGPGRGIRYQLSDNEFIQPAASVDYYGQGFMEAVRTRTLPHPRDWHVHANYRATGGRVLEEWDFPTNVTGTRIPSLEEVRSKVHTGDPGAGGEFPPWPSSPGASRGDSGVWRKIVALIKSTGPVSGSFGNSYRHGDPLWHGSGRAVDWMGYNQDALSRFFFGMRGRLLEFIHRTSTRDYAVTRGRDRGSFSNSLMEAHRNHVHVAMADGGMVQVPRIKYDTGGLLAPGLTLADNRTGGYEYINTAEDQRALVTAAARDGDRPLVNVENMHVTDASPHDIAVELLWEYKTKY